jgi:hypothetical protein
MGTDGQPPREAGWLGTVGEDALPGSGEPVWVSSAWLAALARQLAGDRPREGTLERRQLARLVHADLWGPGRFTPAMRQAVAQGKVRRTGRGRYAPVPGAPGPGDHPLPADRASHGSGTGERP